LLQKKKEELKDLNRVTFDRNVTEEIPDSKPKKSAMKKQKESIPDKNSNESHTKKTRAQTKNLNFSDTYTSGTQSLTTIDDVDV